MTWPPTRDQWIAGLELFSAICLFVASTADLGLPDMLVRWIIVVAGIAMLIRRRLEAEARTDALYTEPPTKDEGGMS